MPAINFAAKHTPYFLGYKRDTLLSFESCCQDWLLHDGLFDHNKLYFDQDAFSGFCICHKLKVMIRRVDDKFENVAKSGVMMHQE